MEHKSDRQLKMFRRFRNDGHKSGIVREIRQAAIDGKVPATQLLRLTKVLAAQLGKNQFEDWVHRELNGYGIEDELPDYRVLMTQSRGTFLGTFGRSMSNAIIPLDHLGDGLEELVSRHEVRQSTSSLEATIKGSESTAGTLKVYWPTGAVQTVGLQIYEDFRLAEAWQIVPVSSLVAIIDTVRNRILDLALELESASSEESLLTPADIPDEIVARSINTFIFGGNNVVAAGSSNVVQSQTLTLRTGDMEGLLSLLKSHGVDAEDLKLLRESIEADEPAKDGRFGGRVSTWIGMMVSKAASGAWNVTTTAAGQLLSKALLRYYGLE